jgi:hypothetical protein
MEKITAEQARVLQGRMSSIETRNMKNLYVAIRNAASLGADHVFMYFKITVAMEKELTDSGFGVTDLFDHKDNSYLYKITW